MTMVTFIAVSLLERSESHAWNVVKGVIWPIPQNKNTKYLWQTGDETNVTLYHYIMQLIKIGKDPLKLNKVRALNCTDSLLLEDSRIFRK